MSEHWEKIYSTKGLHEVSWTRPHLDSSLKIIDAIGLPSDASIIDIGTGASTLADDLLDRGYSNLTLLDISATGLEHIRTRLGNRSENIVFLTGNITTVEMPEPAYDLWHDRAVFHFLTDKDGRNNYLGNLSTALRPGGHLIMATFADDGPLKCSGLDIQRYDIDLLGDTLGSGFSIVETFRELHHTPFGTPQKFLYAHFRREP